MHAGHSLKDKGKKKVDMLCVLNRTQNSKGWSCEPRYL